MKIFFTTILFMMTSLTFAADHAGLESNFKCAPSSEGYNLVKELKAISINKVNNVKNIYNVSKIDEITLVEGITLDACSELVIDLEIGKLRN